MSVPIHGNYHGYYLKRPSVNDPRLGLLPDDTFKSKTVLDIGCNEGWVTCEIGQSWGAHKVIGVDIDDTLIRAAWKKRQLVWSLQKPQKHSTGAFEGDEGGNMIKVDHDSDTTTTTTIQDQADYFPVSLQHSFGPLPIPPSQIRGKHVFPHNVSFRTADWTKESIVEDTDGYDVVIAFSISKWIHVNGGDEGLRAFFQRIHSVLKPGGVFILEPQEWDTYKKVRRLNESLKSNILNLKLRPSDFESILGSLGFGPARHLGPTGEGGKCSDNHCKFLTLDHFFLGFCRMVDLYVKLR
ncbi:Bicoid-interacting protein 3-domain-containing protein [Rhodocollybia butyracea]|uniref:RNA methyltransferase n=1 Tax=Rhodocollybia butyracea TaxID=206335 RepID=A0A9P5UAI5_9AGAR|nr:Bicoid-interacting protein 3-domain-containing protein [Rhodocollybia butyracea]